MKLRGLLLLAAMLTAAGASAGQDSWEYPATINSSGHGTASAEPDVATVTFGVNITGSTPEEAVDEAARLMDAAMAAARSHIVRDGDMHTTGYNLWVQEVWDEYEYAYTGEMEYVVNHYVQADIRDISRVGDLLSAVVNAGANSITGVYFRVEDTAGLYEEARRNAARNAREKAEQLADAFDVQLGPLQSVSEWTNDYYQDYGYGYDSYMGAGGYSAQPPSITPGAFSVTVEVSATYEVIQ